MTPVSQANLSMTQLVLKFVSQGMCSETQTVSIKVHTGTYYNSVRCNKTTVSEHQAQWKYDPIFSLQELQATFQVVK